MEQIRTLDPKKIREVNSQFVNVFDEYDEEDNKTEIVEIDWEFTLFKATPYQLEQLMKNFQPIAETSKVTGAKQLVGVKQPKIIV